MWEMIESGERRAHLAHRMEQPGFEGTGRLQQEQGLTTPHFRVSGRSCETERQLSRVTEPWSFKRLLLRGFLRPGRGSERTAKAEGGGKVEIFTRRVEGHGGRTQSS